MVGRWIGLWGITIRQAPPAAVRRKRTDQTFDRTFSVCHCSGALQVERSNTLRGIPASTDFTGEDMADGLGVAVIGAGMAGRAHAAAYRTASALYDPGAAPRPTGVHRRCERRVLLARRQALRVRAQ